MNPNQNPTDHPTREELTRYVFAETAGEPRTQLENHLSDCSDCAGQLAEMRETLHRLNHWQIPARPRRRRFNWQPLKWAAAAAILLAVGLGVGRFTVPATPDIAALRTEIKADLERTISAELQKQLRDTVSTKLQAALSVSREEDRQFALALFENLQREHTGNYVSLRRDLETLATFTEDEMLDTRRSIFQVAALANQAVGHPIAE